MNARKKAGKSKKTAEEEYRRFFCEKCGARLSSQETRVYLENLYGIDPIKDKRRICFSCKKAENYP